MILHMKFLLILAIYMSRVTRKPDFCLCENKGADQLRSNCEADQRLCFRYTDSTLSLLIKSEISSFYAASGTVHVGLCQTWSETPKTGFLASRLNIACSCYTYEPRRQKTGLRGFRPGLTQTSLCSYRR